MKRNSTGQLVVTDDLLRAYFTRPEIHPIEESCETEHRIFETLMADPNAKIGDKLLSEIVDQDTASNYRVVLEFRDRLTAHGTLESAYLSLFSETRIDIPPVFIDQIVHLILRNILDEVSDPLQLRAAELFFRDQLVTLAEETLMLADEEIVEMQSSPDHFGSLGQLLTEAGTPPKQVALDVLDEDNKQIYWERSDRFDTAIDFRFTQPAPDAFARVVEKWIAHFMGIETRIQARQAIRDERWSWHIGCDASSNDILNKLYNGEEVGDEELQRIVALYRLEFVDPSDMMENLRGKPVYLGIAMDADKKVKLKPQNLLLNLPIKSN